MWPRLEVAVCAYLQYHIIVNVKQVVKILNNYGQCNNIAAVTVADQVNCQQTTQQ